MARHLPILVVVPLVLGSGDVFAQSLSRPTPVPVVRQASAAGARLHGVVRDEAGRAVDGVSVFALGTTLASVRTDGRGEFSLTLPLGEDVLRAAREGYLSTYREAVRVQTNVSLERNITLIRLDRADPAAEAGAPDALGTDPPGYVASEAAWRLRHLTRSVLRDTTPLPEVPDDRSADALGLNRRPLESSRSAMSLLAADLAGQVNLLTTSTVASSSGWMPQLWPHGIANVSVGAPVGLSGEWSVRAAMGAGDLPSWTLAGEFKSDTDRTHAYQFGVSYATQALLAVEDSLADLPPDGSRSVGGFVASDHWRLASGVDLDYGLRFDRYDYLSAPNLVSPRVGARVRLLPRMYVVMLASDREVAPGADEFLPPSSSGAWLPPERTFSSFIPGMPLASEGVRRYEAGFERQFGTIHRRTLDVRRFSETTEHQVATLFGLDEDSQEGHYDVAPVGDVRLDGWKVGLSGDLLSRLHGSVDFVTGKARWDTLVDGRLWHAAPSTLRRTERLQDVTASLEAAVPETATRVTLAYRMNTGFADPALQRPVTGGRFDLEVHQELPYQPIRHGKVNAVFAIRTLLRDVEAGSSFYDELLTVAPPMRMTCGFQVQF